MTGPADDADLAAFCRAEHPRLVGALSLYTGDAAVAEEVAQDALLRVMDRWDQVRAMEAPGAWAHRVAMNLASSYFRRRAAERRALTRMGPPAESTDPDLAQALVVRRAVADLPERQRRCVVLRHHLGYPVAVTAQVLGISEPAVTSLTYRALRSLRAVLSAGATSEETSHVR